MARDARARALLEAAGWSVITVWECELKADPDGIVERLSHDIRDAA